MVGSRLTRDAKAEAKKPQQLLIIFSGRYCTGGLLAMLLFESETETTRSKQLIRHLVANFRIPRVRLVRRTEPVIRDSDTDFTVSPPRRSPCTRRTDRSKRRRQDGQRQELYRGRTVVIVRGILMFLIRCSREFRWRGVRHPPLRTSYATLNSLRTSFPIHFRYHALERRL